MTRYLVTATGRRLHIVREAAYHSRYRIPALCGAWAHKVAGEFLVVNSPPAPGNAPVCRTCKRLHGEAS